MSEYNVEMEPIGYYISRGGPKGHDIELPIYAVRRHKGNEQTMEIMIRFLYTSDQVEMEAQPIRGEPIFIWVNKNIVFPENLRFWKDIPMFRSAKGD